MRSELEDKFAGELVNEFKIYLLTNKFVSKNTLISYEHDILDFFKFIKSHFHTNLSKEVLVKLTISDIRSWLANQVKIGLSAKHNARAMSAVKSLFVFLRSEKNINNDIIFSIKAPKISRSLPKAVDGSFITKMIESVPIFIKKDWCIKRDSTLIYLIYGSGMRISEAFSIKKKDIFGENIKILGKGNKERILPILPIINEKLHEYIKSCPHLILPEDKIFVGNNGGIYNKTIFQKLISNLRKHLGLGESVTVHSLRHSFASDLINNGADIRSIQELLGHKNLSTTQIYTKITAKKMVEAYKKFHPK